MKAKIIPVGTVFGRLTVVGKAESQSFPSGDKKSRSLCVCECGAKTTVLNRGLVTGHTKSCGCYNIDVHTQRLTKHGAASGGVEIPEYSIWKAMKQRTLNARSEDFRLYGGRGVVVCDRWSKSFAAFLEDMGARPSSSHSIDRIDNNGNYEPGNCRWATTEEQANNTRRSVWIELNGERYTVSQWSRISGVRSGTIHNRLARGWEAQDAVWASVKSR